MKPSIRSELAPVGPVLLRLPRYGRLALMLAREPTVPAKHRAPLFAAATYAFTPIHWPVNLIPIVGQIDAPLALLFSLRHALHHCPAERSAMLTRKCGLGPAQLDDDLSTLKTVASSLARRSARAARIQGLFALHLMSGFSRRTVRRLFDSIAKDEGAENKTGGRPTTKKRPTGAHGLQGAQSVMVPPMDQPTGETSREASVHKENA